MSAADRRVEKPFSAPWEAQVFALAVKLNDAGVFTWNDWTKTLGAELAAHPERPYYESWLAALELITEGHGAMTGAERRARIAAWERAARATPHGEPILLENAGNAITGHPGPSFDFSPV